MSNTRVPPSIVLATCCVDTTTSAAGTVSQPIEGIPGLDGDAEWNAENEWDLRTAATNHSIILSGVRTSSAKRFIYSVGIIISEARTLFRSIFNIFLWKNKVLGLKLWV